MSLDELRRKIDEIDTRIVALLNERYQTVIEIGRQKKNSLGAIYVPEREKIVFEKVAALNRGPMSQTTLRAVYREIMSGALALEHPLNIAYLGPEGSFTHLAAVSKFGHSVAYVPKTTFSRTSTTGAPTMAACRLKTPRRVLSRTRSTSLSTPMRKSARKSICASITPCFRNSR